MAAQKAILFIFLGCVVFAVAYEEQVLSTERAPKRRLLEVDETRQIFSGEAITRSLGEGQVYFACSIPNSLRVDDCMAYEYVSTGPIIAFVVNRTVYQNAKDDMYVDMEHFTFGSLAEDSLCLGPHCSRRVDFKDDKEWCLAFANVDVPNLNYVRREDESISFTYEFETCISKGAVPLLVAQGSILMLLVVVSLGLCTYWLFRFWRKMSPELSEAQEKPYPSLPSFSELKTPLVQDGR